MIGRTRTKPPYSLSFAEFRNLASQGNLIPLYREILADFETPVSAFAKIDHGPSGYLLESVEGGENWARYSFLGSGSPLVIRDEGGAVRITQGSGAGRGRTSRVLGSTSEQSPLDCLQAVLAQDRPESVPAHPRYLGGAVG